MPAISCSNSSCSPLGRLVHMFVGCKGHPRRHAENHYMKCNLWLLWHLTRRHVRFFPPMPPALTKQALAGLDAPVLVIVAKRDIFGGGEVTARRAREVFRNCQVSRPLQQPAPCLKPDLPMGLL
jgi:hypothetical protein